MTRRELFQSTLAALLVGGSAKHLLAAGGKTDALILFELRKFLAEQRADKKKVHIEKLPLGKRIISIGERFLGTPYQDGTLEINEKESCIVNLHAFDCVTFMESSLALGRMIPKIPLTVENLRKEITKTRYRDGVINGYTSRLHYTIDWIRDNMRRSNVNDITSSLGGVSIDKKINFMSKHPEKYKQLAGNHERVEEIEEIEEKINASSFIHIPKDKVEKVSLEIENGDIIAITTSVEGLDCSHVGLAKKVGTRVYFLHASLTAKKVILTDKTLAEYLADHEKQIGIIVARPIGA